MRIILAIIFLIGLIYILLPGPDTIDDFPRLPDSVKSELTGDTVQNTNIAAYYSDFDRNSVTKFYYQSLRDGYCKATVFGFPNPLCYIPPIRLNQPPEKAFVYIRDQEESTYLEEYLLPLRESIFVNGDEPIGKDGKPFTTTSVPILVDGTTYFSKTTIRYFPSSVFARVFIYLGIWVAGFFLVKLTKKVHKNV